LFLPARDQAASLVLNSLFFVIMPRTRVANRAMNIVERSSGFVMASSLAETGIRVFLFPVIIKHLVFFHCDLAHNRCWLLIYA